MERMSVQTIIEIEGYVEHAADVGIDTATYKLAGALAMSGYKPMEAEMIAKEIEGLTGFHIDAILRPLFRRLKRDFIRNRMNSHE